MAVPRIITEARAKISQLVFSPFFRHGRNRGVKAMKTDYAEKFVTLLDSMLLACVMQFDGRLCRVSNNLARPYTVPEMAQFTNLNQRTVERMIRDLKDLKLINSEKQFKRMFPDGFKVAAVWRVFTRLFWEKLGLWSLFVESVQYAAKHAHLKLKNPIKLVGKKKKPYSITKEQERQSRLNNQRALCALECSRSRKKKGCLGGFQAPEICEVCRLLGF